jgi:DNA polymerase-3 subunit epsilon
MLGSLLSLDLRRRRLLAQAPGGPLREYLSQPFPAPTTDARQAPYLALDLETTGLDPRSDAILSIGMVAMNGVQVELKTADHRIVQANRPLAEENVVLHRLTDDRVASGESLVSALTLVLKRLAGRVLLAHHAEIEVYFLRFAMARVFGGGFLAPVVDTQWIAHRTLERRNLPFAGTALRLFNLRKGYNLPRYNAHNALSDALATAELYAAQIAERQEKGPLPLKAMLRRL